MALQGFPNDRVSSVKVGANVTASFWDHADQNGVARYVPAGDWAAPPQLANDQVAP